MASINDVFNQLVTVNATLSALGADINNGTVATNAVKTSVDKLDTDLQSGFAQTVNALGNAVNLLKAIATTEIEGVKILFHLSQQTDTMICSLDHISQNTCALLTQSASQTKLQTKMGADLSALLALAQSAYPGAALEGERLATLQAEIRRCCPPPVDPPACVFDPCPKPRPIGEPKLPQLPKDGGRQPVG